MHTGGQASGYSPIHKASPHFDYYQLGDRYAQLWEQTVWSVVTTVA